MLAARIAFAAMAVEAGVRAQPVIRAELPGIRGEQTLTAEARSLHLPGDTPSDATRLGYFDWNADGRPELFVGWRFPRPGCDNCETPYDNYIRVLRPRQDGSTVTVQDVAIAGTELVGSWFYRSPDRRDTPKVVASLLGGATWAHVYLLRPGQRAAQDLSAENDHEFVDLNGDGVYEYVAWERRPDDRRCRFGFFGVRVNPEVHDSSERGFAKIWPPDNAGRTQVMAAFVELDQRGTVGMIALEDDGRNQAGAQRLAVYGMRRSRFRLLSAVAVPWPRIAVIFDIDDAKKALRLRTASLKSCAAGGNPETATRTTLYSFRDGHIRPAPAGTR